jgi:multidrug resistance protein, MATE family
MSIRPNTISEVRRLLKIGGPLTLTALANMSLSITDVVMMGWLGPKQLGAGAAISDLYSILFYLAAGIAAAGSPILATMRGAHTTRYLRGAFAEIVLATLAFGLLLVPLAWHSALVPEWLGMEVELLPDATRYAHWLAMTLLPMLLVRVCISWFSAIEATHVVLVGTLVSIPLNILGNGMFMFGWFGAPILGMPGAGVSSFLIAVLLAIYLMVAVIRSRPYLEASACAPTAGGIRDCWATGLPIGISSLAELGVFLSSTVIIIKFGAAAVAAHAVALRLSGLLYAFTLGISQAVTVRVAHWRGTGDPDRVRVTARIGIGMAVVLGLIEWIMLWTFAQPIVELVLGSSVEPTVSSLAITLILILAPLEAISTVGTVAIGALRGVKDTRVPMYYSLYSLWGVGFPVALYLAFARNLGTEGFWIGLLVGTLCITVLCVARVLRILLSAEPVSLAKARGIRNDLA